LPDFTVSKAGLLTTALTAGFLAVFLSAFATGLAGLFCNALRAEAGGAALDGFDFAAIFLDFATALAMADNNPKKEGEDARLTPL
jgi:hypothetical protein